MLAVFYLEYPDLLISEYSESCHALIFFRIKNIQNMDPNESDVHINVVTEFVAYSTCRNLPI